MSRFAPSVNDFVCTMCARYTVYKVIGGYYFFSVVPTNGVERICFPLYFIVNTLRFWYIRYCIRM